MLNKITIYVKSTGKLWAVMSKEAKESTDGFTYSEKDLQKFYEQLSSMKNNLVIKNEVDGTLTMTDKGLTYEPIAELPIASIEIVSLKQTVEGLLEEREHTYGDYMTNAILSQKLKTVMRESQNWDRLPMDMKESFEMIAVKLARSLNGDYTHIDSWKDVAGYATLISDRLQKA